MTILYLSRTIRQKCSLPEAILGIPSGGENIYPIKGLSGQIKPYIVILKNGRSVTSLKQLDTVIVKGDVIAVFPPVAGG